MNMKPVCINKVNENSPNANLLIHDGLVTWTRMRLDFFNHNM